MSERPHEIVFLVEQAPEGGYLARALDHAIVIKAKTLSALHQAALGAVHRHFDKYVRPDGICLRVAEEGEFACFDEWSSKADTEGYASLSISR